MQYNIYVKENNMNNRRELDYRRQHIIVNKSGKLKDICIQKQYATLYYIKDRHLFERRYDLKDIWSDEQENDIDLGEVIEIKY